MKSFAIAIAIYLAAFCGSSFGQGNEKIPGQPGGPEFLQQPTGYAVTEGYNYWLPEWVEQHEHARLVATGNELTWNVADLEGDWAVAWRPRWNWFHVGDGVFDWSSFDAKLEDAANGGFTVQLNLFSGEADYVPTWVFAKHGITPDDYVQIGDPGRIYAPIWRSEVRAEFEKFVAAAGARYAGHPQISGWYIHGISASQGEELWIGTWDSTVELYYAGCPPETLSAWLSDRIDAFGDAFDGHTHQLMWVGHVESNQYFPLPPDAPEGSMKWTEASSILAHRAWSRGMGHRGGNIERVWNNAGWKSRADTTWAQQSEIGTWYEWDHRHGYLQLDESIWPFEDRRIAVGEENEEYGELPGWFERFGPVEHHPIRYELSMFRALQMRLTDLWVHGNGVAMGPELTNYVRLCLGKWWDDSPDAFSRLCSAPSSDYYVGGGGVPGIDGRLGLHYMRNIERLLHQRDVPSSGTVLGGITVPADRVNRTYGALNLSHSFGSAYWYDNLAIRTDVATSNPCVYFRVDPRWEPDDLVKLMVTYRDTGFGSWRVDYTNEAGAISTEWVNNSDSGSILTAEFMLEQPKFEGRFGGELGMDFRILVEEEDVEFRLVRIVRWINQH